jgi:hypothetical protein
MDLARLEHQDKDTPAAQVRLDHLMLLVVAVEPAVAA